MATTTSQYAAPFLQPLGGVLADYTAGLLTQPQDISGMLPQVAGTNVLQQQALQQQATQAGLGALQFNAQGELVGAGQGTGIAGYQPYLQGAAALATPQGYQQYMSPYQQDVINTTLANYDIQAQKGLAPLAANAVNAGAFGGAREGIQRAEYQAASDRNRAAIEAQLRQSGFTQAQDLANRGYGQLTGLASLQPSLAYGTASQLGAAGNTAQQYSQGILNALQQGSVLQAQYPMQRLGGIADIFGKIAQATPGTPGQPITTNPFLTGAQAFASIYGPYAQSKAVRDALLIKQGIDPTTQKPFPTTTGKTTGSPSPSTNWWDMPIDPSFWNTPPYYPGNTGGEQIYTDYGTLTGDFTGGLPEYTNY